MSRESSKKQFLQHLEIMLLEGVDIGVNSLSKRADLNKVLLYRYFGDLDGLYKQYAKSVNIWGDIFNKTKKLLDSGSLLSANESIKFVFKEYRETLFKSPIYIKILKNDFYNQNPLTQKLESDRETMGIKLLTLINNHFPNVFDLKTPYQASFIVGGITYLALKSTENIEFTGLDLSNEDTWQKLDSVWIDLIDKLF